MLKGRDKRASTHVQLFNGHFPPLNEVKNNGMCLWVFRDHMLFSFRISNLPSLVLSTVSALTYPLPTLIDWIVYRNIQTNLRVLEVSANDGIVQFLSVQFWFIECGGFVLLQQKGTLFILFKVLAFQYSWLKQGWIIHKIK